MGIARPTLPTLAGEPRMRRTPPEGPTRHVALSIDALYRRYSGWLAARLRRRFGSAHAFEAEDLVQEAYLRLSAYQAKAPVLHPRAFLLQVATNLAYSQLRTAGRRQGSAQLQVEPRLETSEHVSLSDQDEVMLLGQLISALPEPQRDVFVLSRFGGLTNQDIAAQLGISVKTVEWRMTRALTSLAAHLAHDGMG